MGKNLVFDLDNTLIFTNALNNEAYNYALEYCNLHKITNYIRIERSVILEVYPSLDITQLDKIIELKQNYFLENINKTKPNLELINILKSNKKQDCVLWSSADKKRAKALLDYYKIKNAFNYEIYTDKKDIKKDIENICIKLSCKKEDLLVYEDSVNCINTLQKLQIQVQKITNNRSAEDYESIPNNV